MTIYQYGKLLIVLTAIHVVLPIEKILGMVDDFVNHQYFSNQQSICVRNKLGECNQRNKEQLGLTVQDRDIRIYRKSMGLNELYWEG